MHYSQDCVNMIGLGLNIHFNELNWMLMGRHKQINQLKQGNAFNGEQASINQETGGILETCAQIQKRLGELNGRNKPERHRWTHTWGGGNEGQVKHIRTGHTGNTHGLEVKSLRPEQRWVFNNNRKRLWMRDMMWGQTRPRDRGQIWHHAPCITFGAAEILHSSCEWA